MYEQNKCKCMNKINVRVDKCNSNLMVVSEEVESLRVRKGNWLDQERMR